MHQRNAAQPVTSVDASPEVSASNAEQLGMFLRTRRESLNPNRLGLARYGRTRTPGLRREEVAQLAEIGVDWYTKLEQGRPAGVSAQTLKTVAAALQCTPSETQHLFTLAGLNQRNTLDAQPLCERIAPSSQLMLDQLDPLPSVLQNAQFDVVGYNAAYCRLMGVDLGTLPPEDRNCIYLALTHQNWKAALLDYDDLLARMVAMFRAAMAEHLHDSAWQAKLKRYMDMSPDFCRLWEQYQVEGVENHVKHFNHPALGELHLLQTNWWSAPMNGPRLLVYVPADDSTKRAIYGCA